MTVKCGIERLLEREPESANDLLSWLIFLKSEEYDQTLSIPERYVISIDSLIRDTLNGGFDQFFYNSGQWANDVLPALEAIDDEQIHKIYQEVFKLYSKNGRVPHDREQRVASIEFKSHEKDFSARVEALDNRFCKLFETPETSEVLITKLFGFISRNRDAFSFEETVYKRWLEPELAEKFPGDAAYQVDLRAGELLICHPSGTQSSLHWSALVGISIVKHGKSRTSLFPWEGPKCPFSGYSWRFSTDESAYAVPFHARFSNELVERIFELPDFDPTTLVEQERFLLCPTGTERICWARRLF